MTDVILCFIAGACWLIALFLGLIAHALYKIARL